jgi:purine catabolism regulator
MTLEAALRLPALRRGAPQVLAGSDQLQRPIRWAHSCEARHVPQLLEGDEVLLMTGMGIPSAGAEQRAFVRDLVAHRVAGLVLELGHVFKRVPEPLVAEAKRQRLPLVALHQEVRFVEVTKQLHTAILSRQLSIERRSGELHARLTEMLIEGAGVPAILDEVAGAIGNPLLLERVGGEVLFHAANGASAEDVRGHWELLRPRVDAGEEDVVAAARVTASGERRWGRVVVVPHERPVDVLAATVLDRVAPLIALALMRTGQEPLLESRERGNFLHDVMADRLGFEDMGPRAVALGLPEHHPRLLGLVLSRRTVGGVGAGAAADEPHAFGALRDVREALRGWAIGALMGTRPSTDDVVMLLALPPAMEREVAVGHVVDAIAAAELEPVAGRSLTVAAGPLIGEWAHVGPALRLAAETAETMRDGPIRRWHDATVPDVERLLWGLRDDERLAAFARQRLAPVLDHDRVRGAAPLLATLESLCDHHWHKADAARALSIRRQSLYARIERLDRVLGADLEDAETRLGLELAVRALRVTGGMG